MDTPRDPPLSRERVLEELRATLAGIGVDPAGVEPGAHLVDDLDLDSLDWVDVALQLEDNLCIALQAERFASLRTVDDAIERIYEALVESTGPAA